MEKKELHEIETEGAAPGKLTLEMTRLLPAPIKNWLSSIGAVGHEQVHSVALEQTGRMKLEPGQKEWTTSEARQTSFTDPPAFRWSAKMKMGKGLFVTAKDSFREGQASMRIKLVGIFPISKSTDNEKTNQSALQRYLMELAWYPSAVLSPLISWEEVDTHSAKATMEYAGLTGSATYFFNEQYELLKVEAWRYKDSDEYAQPLLCIGTIKEHKLVDGLKVPVKVEITWMLQEGPFTWYSFEVHGIRFNSMDGPYRK